MAAARPTLSAVNWTVAAFLIAALPHLAAMPAWLAAGIIAACAWRVGAAWRQWSAPPPLLRFALTGIAIALVVLAFGGLWGRRTATALLCVMLAAKMMEMFTVRDLRLVASVSFFLIAAQFLFSERLLYLGYLAAGSLVATIALVRIQDVEIGLPADGREAESQAVRSAAALLVLALPVALTLFFLFPRLAQPLWGLPDNAMDGRTGLGEDMSPGTISNLFMDDSPAFRVEFEGPPPPAGERYWRGPVLWDFDGTTWRRPGFGNTPSRQFVPEGERSIQYSVQLEPHERRWLFALDYPTRGPEQAVITVDHQMLNRHPVTTLTRYEVTSNPDFIDMPELSDGARSAALRLPEGRNPRALERAAELREQYPDDEQLIDAVLGWFRNEAFYYSLSASPLGRHGADEFLFDLRTGYCEYYASAFAILMRAAGIPTRVVTGYQGGLWQAGSAYLLVRQSDAHAWTEVWLDGRGWTRVDPTAAVSPDRIEQGARSVIDAPRHRLDLDWVQNLRNRYDRIQHLWNRWVLGFDHERQRRFLAGLGLPELSAERIAGLMILLLMLVSGLISLFLLRPGERRAATPADRAWLIMLKRLKRQGLVKRADETPLEFARRVETALPTQGSVFHRLTEIYCRIHYGAQGDHVPRFIEQARTFAPGKS